MSNFSWNAGMKAYEWAFKKRKNLDFISGKNKNRIVSLNKNILGKEKEFPSFSKKSFSNNWESNLK
jgi:L-lactate dehydrogenase complex protein LldF